jgi:hypothetical protein
VIDRNRGPEPIAMPSSESAAADAARKTWVSLAWGAGSGRFHVGARLISLQDDGPSVTCSIPPPLGRRAEIVLDISGRRELTSRATVAGVRALGPGVYLVRLQFAESCEPAFWDAASASVEGVT